MKTIALLAAGLCLSGNALATNYGNWKYIKSNGLTTIQSPQGPTLGASGSAPSGGGADGLNIFGFPSGTVPAGKTTMIMRFDFKSNGFFTAEPSAHLPILLLAKWQNSNPTPPTPGSGAGYLVGRGISIGNVSGAPSGCSASNIIEIESFRPTGNKLYPASCSAGGTGPANIRLNENTTYHIDIFASKTNFIQGQNFNVIYSILSSTGTLLHQGFALDVTTEIPTDLGGWGIGRVISNTNPNTNWSIEFNNLSVEFVD